MIKKVSSMLVLAALIGALAAVAAGVTASPAAAASPTATGPLNIPVTSAQSGGVLNGTFTITSFAVNQLNQLVANGTFTGTANGAPVTATPASAPVTNAAGGGSCQILDLMINPLHLDLLGLVVDLDAVHLNITAQQGPGNLLGNLLCALTGLLDNTGQGNGATALLSKINGLVA